ncbi:MAG: efflux RND transporter periplasmic adaptor subunit [Planctomycetia bacterium]|nr:efflux RND transporter periplasmic adaptor subunit [Planctomycetia bacterium]
MFLSNRPHSFWEQKYSWDLFLPQKHFIGILWALGGLLCFCGCYEKPIMKSEITAVPVRTAQVEMKDVQLFSYFNGQTEVNPVQIVPRIRGILEEIKFKPGEIVEKGAELFVIERVDYANAFAGFEADLASAKAHEVQAKATHERNIYLRDNSGVQGVVTQSEIDESLANWQEATAKVAKAEANLADAKIQLERTVIKAPTRGKISRNLIEVGNLVDGTTGNPPLLATIMPLDTMFVYFKLTDSIFNYLQQRVRNAVYQKLTENGIDPETVKNKASIEIAEEQGLSQTLEFEMKLLIDNLGQPEESFPYKGTIDYNDNIIDKATGTITIRGKIDNSDYTLYPGYICKVKIPGTIIPQAVLVQEKAICYDLNEVFVWVLDENQLPQKQTVVLGELLEDGTRVINSGLQGNETYILDGTQKVKAGVPIKEIESGTK